MNSYSYHLAKRFLSRRNAEHLGQFPPVACFAFDAITLAIHLDGQYEKDELAFLATRVFPQLPGRAACLDIGANIGNHSLHFARHFERVIAFEPHPRTYRLLACNAELMPNVVPLNCGASAQAGRISVHENPSNMGATSIGVAGDAAGRRVQFELRRIDEVAEVASCEHISFVKIDVEGHELEALRGAEATLRRHRPLIAMEVLGKEVVGGSSPAVDYLRSIGYACFYELADRSPWSRLPRPLYKLVRALLALATGRRPSGAKRLLRVDALAPRSYAMLLCAVEPLANVEAA